jgi:amidase
MLSMLRREEVTPEELLAAHLAEIERVNPTINAFVTVSPQRGKAAGPLAGIPVTVKDSFNVAGFATRCGSQLRSSRPATEDSTAAARLRAAGAVILGKTNCPDLLLGYETDNLLTGRTNNPWNPERTVGASSGGEAAAIAAGCSAGGVGSDAGGSIRLPAHFCGIAGLKPTPGRVPATGHFPSAMHPLGLLGVAGPMARSAEDVRLLFEVLAGYDEQDPFSAPVPLRTPELARLRIGLVEQFYRAPVQAGVRRAVARAGALLSGLGFPVEPLALRGLERAPDVWWTIFARLTAPIVKQMLAGREADVHELMREILEQGTAKPAPSMQEVVETLAARDRMRAALLRNLPGRTVLLMPVCGVAAFPHRERSFPVDGKSIGLWEAMLPAVLANVLGLPAVTIPMDLNEEGLPVGIQLVGRPYDDELLLEVAVRLERARGPFAAPSL